MRPDLVASHWDPLIKNQFQSGPDRNINKKIQILQNFRLILRRAKHIDLRVGETIYSAGDPLVKLSWRWLEPTRGHGEVARPNIPMEPEGATVRFPCLFEFLGSIEGEFSSIVALMFSVSAIRSSAWAL